MGLMNSAWVHCSREKSQMLRLDKKKKKERNMILKHKRAKRQIQTGTLCDVDNALKCILVIYLCGHYLLITMLNLYN